MIAVATGYYFTGLTQAQQNRRTSTLQTSMDGAHTTWGANHYIDLYFVDFLGAFPRTNTAQVITFTQRAHQASPARGGVSYRHYTCTFTHPAPRATTLTWHLYHDPLSTTTFIDYITVQQFRWIYWWPRSATTTTLPSTIQTRIRYATYVRGT